MSESAQFSVGFSSYDGDRTYVLLFQVSWDALPPEDSKMKKVLDSQSFKDFSARQQFANLPEYNVYGQSILEQLSITVNSAEGVEEFLLDLSNELGIEYKKNSYEQAIRNIRKQSSQYLTP